jgi:hypothetical protein
VIAVTSQIGVTAPISSDEGVWGIIRGGKFLSPNPNMSQIQDKLRETMRLSALAQVLKSMVGLLFHLDQSDWISETDTLTNLT